MILCLEFPEFETPAEAEIALAEICEDAEEVMYGDWSNGTRKFKARTKVNGYLDRFIAKCKRLSSGSKDEWDLLITECLKVKDKMIAVKAAVRELDKIY